MPAQVAEAKPPTDEQVVENYKELGFVEVTAKQLESLRGLGLHVRQEGILTTQRGTAMFNQMACMDAMNMARKVLAALMPKGRKPNVQTVEKVEAMLKAMALLSGKLTESQEIMLNIEGGSQAVQTGAIPDKLVKAFKPGSDVKGGTLVVANNVQINEPAKKSS